MSEATRSILKDKLFTVGELLRQNQLAPFVPTETPAVFQASEGG